MILDDISTLQSTLSWTEAGRSHPFISSAPLFLVVGCAAVVRRAERRRGGRLKSPTNMPRRQWHFDAI